jgi:hypothetical protein
LKEEKMGKGEYITCRRGEKEINFEFQKLKGKKLLVKLDGKIILKCPFEK